MSDLPAAAAQPTSLWRNANFLRFWAAQGISVFGSQFTELALPLVAVLLLQASATEMGILKAAETAPFLLIALFAGVWVDRLPRKPILVVGDLGRALVLASVPLTFLAGALSMPQLYLVGLLVGVLTVFFDVAYQAYVPALVGRSQLIETNSKLEVTRSTAQVAGPGLAGLIVQALSAPFAVALDAVSFLVSGALIAVIRRPEPQSDRSPRSGMWAQIREGLGVVFGNPHLRAIAGCTATFNLFESAWFALFVLYATRDLRLSPAQIGLVFSLGSLGALAGALLAGRAADRLGLGRAILLGAVCSGIGGWAAPLAAPENALPLLILGVLVTSLGIPLYNINQVSLRQAITPLRLQGRMNATMRFLVWGTMPIGGLLGGVLGDAIDLRPTMLLTAVGSALAVLWIALSPVRSLQRIPEPTE